MSDREGISYWYDFDQQQVRRIEAQHYFSDEGSRNFFRIYGVVPLSATRYLMSSKQGLLIYDLSRDEFYRQRVFAQGKPLESEQALLRLMRGEKGMFWAETQNSLVGFTDLRHSLGLLRNYHYEGERRWRNRVTGINGDGGQHLWFGTSVGFTRLDLKTTQTKSYQAVAGATDRLNIETVRGIGHSGHYVVLAPVFNGVWLFDPATECYRRPQYAGDRVRTASENDFLTGLHTLHNGNHLILGSQAAYILDSKTLRLDFLRSPNDEANTFTACQDAQGQIWVGTSQGIYGLSEDGKTLLGTALTPAGVLSLLATGNGEWLAGTEQGLCKIRQSGSSFQTDTISAPFDGNMVTMLYRDNRHRYWIGTIRGLFLADAALRIFRKFDFADNAQGPIYHANTAFMASDGMLFLGGSNGLNYLYPESFELEDVPPKVMLQSLDINGGDSVLYNLDAPINLTYWQNKLAFEVLAPYFNNVGKLQYRYLLEGLSTDWVYNGNNNVVQLPGLPPGTYRLRVAASASGQHWSESGEGVSFVIRPPWWQTWLFRIAALGLLAILLFWEIYRREKSLHRRQQKALEMEHLKNTALQYQLETEQVINYFSTAITTASTVEQSLWNVAQKCISRLHFEDCVIYLLDEERKVWVQKAAWGNKSTGDERIVNSIDIPFGKGIVGAAALKGEAELVPDTSLDPRYVVDDRNRASELAVPILLDGTVIGVIDSEHSQRNFYTPWHVQMMTAIAALLGNKIALDRTEEARRAALLQAVDNQRKAAEAKLQSMRLQMKPHFLFNALNSIQQMILTGNETSATLYLSKFSKLLRMVLTHSDKELVSLREELEMLELYVALESRRFDGTFRYEIAGAPGLDTDDYQVPTLLIQPFVENAIWHGLLHKDGPRQLRVTFDADDDENLVCTIEDNGIGRAAAQAFSQHDGNKHTGKGMSVSSERLETLNSQHGQHNRLVIEDLYDAAGHAAGTRVMIHLVM